MQIEPGQMYKSAGYSATLIVDECRDSGAVMKVCSSKDGRYKLGERIIVAYNRIGLMRRVMV